MTIIQLDGSEREIPDDSAVAQAYRALDTAAHRMGRNGYAAHLKSKRAKLPYTPTQEHRDLCDAMPRLLAGTLSPNDAMAMLHGYDTLKQRLG
jgi:hypothetical protein